MLFNSSMMTISNYLNSTFTVQARGIADEPYKLHEFVLKEDDSNSRHEIKIKFSPNKFKVTIFKSDYKNNNQSDNLLKIFNNATKHLTRVPDYIMFIEHCDICKVIIVEMKSTRPNPSNANFNRNIDEYNQKLIAKFNNGKSISQFIFNILNKKINGDDICNLLCIKPLQNQHNKQTTNPVDDSISRDSNGETNWFYEYGEEFRIRDLLQRCFGVSV